MSWISFNNPSLSEHSNLENIVRKTDDIAVNKLFVKNQSVIKWISTLPTVKLIHKRIHDYYVLLRISNAMHIVNSGIMLSE